MPIPERQPISDSFRGHVLKVEGTPLLLREALQAGELLATGDLTVRYAVGYLGKPHLAIVPGLIALDYGEMLTGEEAWEFLLKRSNLYPRADVVGYRNDGEDDMIAVKFLDIDQPVQALVYADPQAVRPIARPVALVAASIEGIAPRLLEYLPHYPSLEAWQAAHE